MIRPSKIGYGYGYIKMIGVINDEEFYSLIQFSKLFQ